MLWEVLISYGTTVHYIASDAGSGFSKYMSLCTDQYRLIY